MLRYSLIATCWLLGATCAVGDIFVWEGIAGNCTLDHDNNTITINEPGTYGFRAWDGSSALEDMALIEVNPAVTGNVTVTIGWDEYGGNGALDLEKGNLTHATYDVYLAGLEISGSLGTTSTGFTCEDVTGNISVGGSIATGGDVTCADVSGDICVGGDLGNLGSPYTEFRADDVAGTFTIAADLWDDVIVNTLGDFTAGDSSGSTVTGDIAIAQPYSGTLTINDTYGGDLTVGGEMSGLIDINRNMVGGSVTIGTPGTNANLSGEIDVRLGGTVVVNGNVSSAGVIECELALNAPIQITGDLSGEIAVRYEISVYGSIDIGGNVTSTGSIDVGSFVDGSIEIGDDLDGQIQIAGDLDEPGRIEITGGVTQADPNLPAMHVQGSITGSGASDPAIEVGGELGGVIAIDGSLNDVSSGADIQVGSIDTENLGAIAIDYDGWDPNDTWEDGAVVRVDEDDYTGNTPSLHIWEINECKGDMTNDGVVDGDDAAAFYNALNYPGQYASDFPGLLGSIVWHGDMDCNSEFNAYDAVPFDYFIDEECTNCTSECQYEACVADINENGGVDHADLGILLAAWGTHKGDPYYNPDADLDGDDYVGHADLGWLLAEWGNPCDCYDGRDGGGEGPGGQGARVSVEPYDTNGFTNDGFAGESDHFVFDLVIAITDPGNDWTTSGVVARAENGATFRLAPGPTDPDQYASFVSAPRVVDEGPPPNNSGASVAGAYLPPDSVYDFASRIINLSWFDKVDSKDGPAAVMRLVIDVSAVPGADTSGGLGSVYFSQTGPARPADIKVVDFRSATGSRRDGGALTGHDGEFFVNAD